MLNTYHDPQDAAREAVRRPDSYADWSDLPLFDTWGLCGPSRTRDSDSLDDSNFETIAGDLESRFPDAVARHTANHWACGWVETLAVQVYAEGPADADGSRPLADSFIALLAWQDRLADYPVADEEDFSRREHEEILKGIENVYPRFPEWDGIDWRPRDPETLATDLFEIGWGQLDRFAGEDDFPREDELIPAAIEAGVYVPDAECVRETLREAHADVERITSLAEDIARAAIEGETDDLRALVRVLAETTDASSLLRVL